MRGGGQFLRVWIDNMLRIHESRNEKKHIFSQKSNQMGEQKVSLVEDGQQMNKFIRALLNDVKALEYMLDNDWFNKDVMHIGAEQEMALVDLKNYKPMPIAIEAMEKMTQYEWLETELAKFNLEICLTPQKFSDDCFTRMHQEISSRLDTISENLQSFDADILLTGILPTLRKRNLEMDNLTPKKRYFALMEGINRQLIGSAYELRLEGIDELMLKHDSPLLEAVNTSFQVHLQVTADEFVKMYNISQAITAPVMAIAANSPIVFGKRLWHESRIAMFQQAIDTRTTHNHMRERSPRVSFGKKWLEKSILEIYKEDISRFRVLISSDVSEDSLSMIKEGVTPNLRALQVHNSTVYRWNRPCYGISPNGKPHLRIENRVIPSGPTVLDEMANAALWLGAMKGMNKRVEDVTTRLGFEDARDNFTKAAKFGIDSKFTWFDDKKITACDLVLEEIIPMAIEGLQEMKVDQADIDKYMSVIKERAEKHMNGARWQLRSFTKLKGETTQAEALTILAQSIHVNQKSQIPGHLWELPEITNTDHFHPQDLKVTEFMQTDFQTVMKGDIIEFVAELMNWRDVKFTPVEDSKAQLVGLVASDLLIKHYANKTNDKTFHTVEEIMIKDPISIGPEASIQEAMNLMNENKVDCLPVVKNDELIGMITEKDFLGISHRLLNRNSG